MLSELWPEYKFSDIFSIFGVTLNHVMRDSGLLDTLQFNHPGCFSVKELDTKVTSGESSKDKYNVSYDHYLNHAHVATFNFMLELCKKEQLHCTYSFEK